MKKSVIFIVVSIFVAGLSISASIMYTLNNRNQGDMVNKYNTNQLANSERQSIKQSTETLKKSQIALVHILEVTPQYNISIKKIPYKHCENVNETIIVSKKIEDGSTGGAIGGVSGAVAGAVIGKHISGNDVGTAIGGLVGAVAGAIAGNRIEKNQSQQVPQEVSRRLCSTRYNMVERKNISGYKVVYEYENQNNIVFTRKKPYGNYIPLNELI